MKVPPVTKTKLAGIGTPPELRWERHDAPIDIASEGYIISPVP